MSQSGPFYRRQHSLNFKTNTNIDRKALSYETNENVNPDKDDSYDLGNEYLVWRNLRVKRVRLLGDVDVTSQFDDNGTAYIAGGLAVSDSIHCTTIVADNLQTITGLTFDLPLQSTGSPPTLKLLYDAATIQKDGSTNKLYVALDGTSLLYDAGSSKIKVNIDNDTLRYDTDAHKMKVDADNVLDKLSYTAPFKREGATLSVSHDGDTLQLNESNELVVAIDGDSLKMTAPGGVIEVDVDYLLDQLTYTPPLKRDENTLSVGYDDSTIKLDEDNKLKVNIPLPPSLNPYRIPFFESANTIGYSEDFNYRVTTGIDSEIRPRLEAPSLILTGGTVVGPPSDSRAEITTENQKFLIRNEKPITIATQKNTGIVTPIVDNIITIQAGEYGVTSEELDPTATDSGKVDIKAGTSINLDAGFSLNQTVATGNLSMTAVLGQITMTAAAGNMDIACIKGNLTIRSGTSSIWDSISKVSLSIYVLSGKNIHLRATNPTNTGDFALPPPAGDGKYRKTTQGVIIDQYDNEKFEKCIYFVDTTNRHIQVDPDFQYDDSTKTLSVQNLVLNNEALSEEVGVEVADLPEVEVADVEYAVGSRPISLLQEFGDDLGAAFDVDNTIRVVKSTEDNLDGKIQAPAFEPTTYPKSINDAIALGRIKPVLPIAGKTTGGAPTKNIAAKYDYVNDEHLEGVWGEDPDFRMVTDVDTLAGLIQLIYDQKTLVCPTDDNNGLRVNYDPDVFGIKEGEEQYLTLKVGTENRVPYYGAGGVWSNSENLTFTGTLLKAQKMETSTGLDVKAGGIDVTLGGISVQAGGISVLGGNLSVSAGTLTVSGAATVNGLLTANLSMVVNGDITLNTFSLSGVLAALGIASGFAIVTSLGGTIVTGVIAGGLASSLGKLWGVMNHYLLFDYTGTNPYPGSFMADGTVNFTRAEDIIYESSTSGVIRDYPLDALEHNTTTDTHPLRITGSVEIGVDQTINEDDTINLLTTGGRLYVDGGIRQGAGEATEAASVNILTGQTELLGVVLFNEPVEFNDDVTWNATLFTEDISCNGTAFLNTRTECKGVGADIASQAPVLITPSTTTVGDNTATYFTYFALPQCMSEGTTPTPLPQTAYTVYIAGAPEMLPEATYSFTGDTYALYVNEGKTYFGGTTEIENLTVNDTISFTSVSCTTLTASGLITGTSGLTITGGTTSIEALAASSTTANPYSLTVTSTSNNRLSIACVNAGTPGTPGISLQRGSSATERNVVYVDSSNNFAIYSNTFGQDTLRIDNTAGTVQLRYGTTLCSVSGTCTIGSSSAAQFSAAGVLTIANTTASTSTTTGCATFAGGIGVAGAMRSASIVTTGTITAGTSFSAFGDISTSSNASGFYQGTGVPSGSPVNFFTSSTEIAGLLTCTNGLTVSSGTSTVQNLTVNGTLTYSGAITTSGAVSCTTLTASQTTILASSSGTTTIGSSTPAQFSASGGLTLQNRLNINSGGVSGSTTTGISISGNSSTSLTNWDQQNENAPNIYEVFAGDFTIRSYWGVAVNLNSAAVNPSFNATNARIANTSSFTINRRAVGASSGVYDTIFSVNGISGNTSVGPVTGSGPATFTTTSANPYAFGVTSTSDNRLNISCVNAGTPGTPGISLQRGSSATERNVVYVDSSNNFAIYSNTLGQNSLTINNATGAIGLPYATTICSTSGTCTIGSGSTALTVSSTGVLAVENATASTSTGTGALICKGGIGAQKRIYSSGIVTSNESSRFGTAGVSTAFTNFIDSTSSNNSALDFSQNYYYVRFNATAPNDTLVATSTLISSVASRLPGGTWADGEQYTFIIKNECSGTWTINRGDSNLTFGLTPSATSMTVATGVTYIVMILKTSSTTVTLRAF